MSKETTPKPVEHRIINSKQCPRCGGTNTRSLGSDDTLTESRLCLDCEAKSSDGDDRDCTYDVCCCEMVEAVRWGTPDGTDFGEEHEVYDSRYLAKREAMNAIACLQEFVRDIDAAYGECLENDVLPRYQELEAEWPDLLDTYRKAKAIIARAKGDLWNIESIS